jgi:hypothetical protein
MFELDDKWIERRQTLDVRFIIPHLDKNSLSSCDSLIVSCRKRHHTASGELGKQRKQKDVDGCLDHLDWFAD